MAYPFATRPTNRAAGELITAVDANADSSALNDIKSELGSGPKGGVADLTTRLANLDTTVSGKSDTSHGHSTITANTQTTAYTLVLSDAGKAVELNSASAVNLTVPPNSSVAFPVGTVVEVYQHGAGQVTLVAGAGVTIRSRGSALKLAGQYATASLRKRATDEWVAGGDLTA